MSHSIADLPPDQQAAWLHGYQTGIRHGIDTGRQQILDEDAAAWARMRQHIHNVAASPDYTTLAERRGQHDRAARQRTILTERGIA